MKTVGIIGGMGPLATAVLFQRIINLTKAQTDQDHIPCLIDNNTLIPDRTNFLLYRKKSPVEQLISSANRLEIAGSEFLIMPCNTAHAFQNLIRQKIEIPLISMTEVVKNSLSRFYQGKKIGIVGTTGTKVSGIYSSCNSNDFVYPSSRIQDTLMNLIYGVKSGENLGNLVIKFENVLEDFLKADADILLIACTELSILFQNMNMNIRYVDSLELLAAYTVIEAGAELNQNALKMGKNMLYRENIMV